MSDNLAPQSGRLLGIPSEVRLLIYEKMFPPCKLDLYAYDNTLIKGIHSRLVASDFLNLLATCRTVHDEATPVLHANTEFHVNFAFGFDETLPILRSFWGDPGRADYDKWMKNPEQEISLKPVRKMSVTIWLSNEVHWSRQGPANTWLEDLPSELDKALHLKELHITLNSRYNRPSRLGSKTDLEGDASALQGTVARHCNSGDGYIAPQRRLQTSHFLRHACSAQLVSKYFQDNALSIKAN